MATRMRRTNKVGSGWSKHGLENLEQRWMLSASPNLPTTAVVSEAVAHVLHPPKALGVDSSDSGKVKTNIDSGVGGVVTYLPLETIACIPLIEDTSSSDELVSDSTASKPSEADCPEIAPADDVPSTVLTATTIHTLGVMTTTEGGIAGADSTVESSVQPADEGIDSAATDTVTDETERPVAVTVSDEISMTSDPDSVTTSTESRTEQSADDADSGEVETPVIYTLDGESSTTDDSGTVVRDDISFSPTTSVQLHRKDVKRIAREMKRGNYVNLDIPALMALHSRAKKQTRELVERVIATTYAQSLPGCVVLPRTSYEQAIDTAFVELGSPTKTLKINGRRYVAPPSG